MTGLIVLGFVLAYVAIAAGIASMAKGGWRVLVIVVFILIPTWDIIPGKIALARLCEQEGGIKIYRSVKGVEGFLSLDGRAYEEYFKRYGYKYVEVAREKRDPKTGKSAGIEYARVTLGDDGNLREMKIDMPRSRFGYRKAPRRGEGQLEWGIVRNVDSIVDLQSDETLATRAEIYWTGNWIQRYASPVLGFGGYCDKDRFEYRRYFVETLRPLVSRSD